MKLEIAAALQGNGLAQEVLKGLGYEGQFPPPFSEAGMMKIEPPGLPTGHAPACR